MTLNRTNLLCLSLYTLGLAAAVMLPESKAQSVAATPQITQAIDVSRTVRIPGSVYPALARATDLGAVPSGQPMTRMVLVLQPSAERSAALARRLDDQQNAQSPSFHHWLSPLDYAALYGPAASDVLQVQGWLKSQGFQVDRVANGGWWIQFSGTAGEVGQAFGTSIHSFSVDGKTHTANTTAISIPEALAPVVSGVLSLHNFPRTTNHTPVQKVARSASGQLMPLTHTTAGGQNAPAPDGTFSNNVHYITPGDLAAIYDTNPLLKQGTTGTGVTIGVLGQTDVQIADIESFRSIFNLPANDPQVVIDGNDPGFPSPDDEEESDLDLEYAGAMAPLSSILFVTSASTEATAGIDLSASYAVDNVLAPILTLSYGSCEAILGAAGNAFYNQLWQQAASEGITVLVSSGDSGSANCDGGGQQFPAVYGLMVNGLASTPYNVAVGGTTFMEGANSSTFWNAQNAAGYSSAIGYIPETAWNDSCDPVSYPAGCVYSGGGPFIEGGGGGASGCLNGKFTVSGIVCSGSYAKPSWQTGPGVPADGARDLPDVALTSSADHDGYLICTEGSCQTTYQNGVPAIQQASIIGGTSAAAPAMAGILALVEQKNGMFQGQANNVLYKLAAAQSAGSCNSSNLTTPTTQSSCIFHDVTAGSNAVPCSGSTPNCTAKLNLVSGVLTGYAAVAGYDQATGLGSVDAANLSNGWQSATLVATATNLTLGSNTAVHGQPLAFSAAVKPATGGGTPSGDLSLNGAGQSTGPFTLAAGAYSGSALALPGGSYSVTAHYAGDSTYAPSTSNPAAVTITPEASNLNLQLYYYNYATATTAIIAGPIPFQSIVYYFAQIQGVSGQGVPTGNVTFTLDGTSLGVFPLNGSGQAAMDYSTLIYPFVLPGKHTLVATYSGDNSFKASGPVTMPLTITTGQLETYAIPNVNRIVQGQPVQILVNPSATYAPYPTGTIQIYDNGVALGPLMTLANDGPQGPGIPQASYNTSSLAVGTHQISASYSGDSNYGAVAATSGYAFVSTVTVTAAAKLTSTVSLTASASALTVGQSLQYAIKVVPTAANSPVPTGTITLSDPSPANLFGFTIAPATPLTNGALTSTQTFYGGGNLLVYASYSGDSKYEASVSPVLLTVYNPLTPKTSLSANAAYVVPGRQSSITLQVTGLPNMPAYTVPTGAVEYFDSLNGAAAKLFATDYLSLGNGNIGVDTLPVVLSAGTHVITAQYTGDANWAPLGANAVTIVVAPPNFNLTTPSGATTVTLGSPAGVAVTATPELNYSGTVAFACTGGLPVGASCSFTPSTVTLAGNAALATTLNLNTMTPTVQTGSVKRLALPGRLNTTSLAAGALLASLLLCGVRRRRFALRSLPVLLLCTLLSVGGCSSGGGGSSGPAAFSLRSDFGTKAAQGSNVSLTASVPGNAAGPVTFLDGTTVLGTAAVANYKANLQVSSLAVGTHTITASYQPSGGQALSATLLQGITGSATVQVTASSGALSHTLNVNYLLQ